jgi:tetratricopeptide (TPR) repeat protein
MAEPSMAKKPVQQTLSVERQQQFSYYWYAAKQAITEERYADALVLLEFCQQINPNDGTTLNMLGIIYDALGQKGKALDFFRRAYEADPRDQWLHYSNALLNQQTEDSQRQAQAVMERSHKINPKDENLLEQLRRIYVAEREWKKCLKIQDEIDAIKGYDVYSAFNRSHAYSMMRKPKKALAEIDKYLEEDATNINFLLYRLDILERHNMSVEERYKTYEQILSYTSNMSVLNNYAWLLATRGGDLRKAEMMSMKTIQEEPNNPVFLDTYGWILHLQGKDDLALFYLQKALWNATAETKSEIETHIKMINRNK